MTDTNRYNRVNWTDFQKATLEDLDTDQEFHIKATAFAEDLSSGSGILLDAPQERAIFDSDDFDDYQQGLEAINSFDGQGVLQIPVLATDQVGGNQLFINLTDLRLDGFAKTTVVLFGKTFESTLVYENIEFNDNIGELTRNHFIEITNIMFQNFRGNTNTSVDGYASMDLGGRIVITEAGSMRLGRDTIVAEQILEPNIVFRDFKTSSSSISLSNAIIAAIGTSNNIDDLDINISAAQTRTFAAGATTSTTYGQKFKMVGDNIQKITLLLGLESGSNWSGSLTIGIRPLQTTVSCSSDFLPDDQIGFDPSTEPVEEITVNQEDLADSGYVLGAETIPVDFVFTSANISNPLLSGLVSGAYYVITIRRSGSSAIGTIFVEEARNSNPDLRLTVFENQVWTDIETSTLWFRVFGDAISIASGVAYDAGIRLTIPKTIINTDGALVQNNVDNIDLINTGEDAENYIIVQKSEEFVDTKKHPRTGDQYFSRKQDAPAFSAVSQDDLETLIDAGEHTVVIGRVRDRNARANPTITGQFVYPCLVINNELNVLDPSTDLLTQNVVGSIITPDILQPSFKYRIISQEIISDVYGDLNADGLIDVSDAARLQALDGYAVDLNGGTVSAAIQKAAVLNGSVSVAELLRADLDGSGVITLAGDLAPLNSFIDNGTAFGIGAGFTRVLLKVETILNPQYNTDADGNSTLELQNSNAAFTNNTSFATINFSIEFLPTWIPDKLELLDLRRYITTTFLDFSSSDLQSDPENGGRNSLFVPGDLYLTGNILELDGSFHPLDFETNIIEIELPEGGTSGYVDIFNNFVVSNMRFSDGSLVSSSAINNNQVRFEVSISSITKNTDGYDVMAGDGYSSEDIQETVSTYMDHSTGLLRIFSQDVVWDPLFPQFRTRIIVKISLKKAGFINSVVYVNPTMLGELLL